MPKLEGQFRRIAVQPVPQPIFHSSNGGLPYVPTVTRANQRQKQHMVHQPNRRIHIRHVAQRAQMFLCCLRQYLLGFVFDLARFKRLLKSYGCLQADVPAPPLALAATHDQPFD